MPTAGVVRRRISWIPLSSVPVQLIRAWSWRYPLLSWCSLQPLAKPDPPTKPAVIFSECASKALPRATRRDIFPCLLSMRFNSGQSLWWPTSCFAWPVERSQTWSCRSGHRDGGARRFVSGAGDSGGTPTSH